MGGVWSQAAKLTADDGATDDHFGGAVSVSGDVVMVGATGDDDRGGNSGSVYVFTHAAAAWSQAAKLTADDGAANDGFGDAISISGDVAAIGAPWNDDACGDSGSTYVFTRVDDVWSQAAKLTATDGAAGDWFGRPVSVSGDVVLVGANRNDDAGSDSGSAYFFTADSCCSNPEAGMGDIIFNTGHRVLQWCDGVAWQAVGPIDPPGPNTGCTNPERDSGRILFNQDACVMQYCDGDTWQEIGQNDPCACGGPGTECTDGTLYAGRSPDGDVPLYTTPADIGEYAGGPTGNTAVVDCTAMPSAETGCRTGAANTATLAGLPGAYAAAKACANLAPPMPEALGHDDWYLPSQYELNVLYAGRAGIGGFQAAYYWSSSENASDAVWARNFNTHGFEAGDHRKHWPRLVRCVRKR